MGSSSLTDSGLGTVRADRCELNVGYYPDSVKKGNGATEADVLAALHAESDPFVDANYERLSSYGTVFVVMIDPSVCRLRVRLPVG